MATRTKLIWAFIVFGLIAAICIPLLRKSFSAPRLWQRFCFAESSLACDRQDWVRLNDNQWQAYLPDGTCQTYEFVRRERGFLSNGTVVKYGQFLVYIPDEGEESSLRVMKGGEWFNYLDMPRHPSQIEVSYQDGAKLLANKQAAEAIKLLDRSIEQDPRFTAAYILRATAYFQIGKMDKAIADCNKAIALTSKCSAAETLLKKASEHQGKSAKP